MDSDFWKSLEYAYCWLNSDSSQIRVTPPVPVNCIYWRVRFAFNSLETLPPTSRHQKTTSPLKSHLSISRKGTTKVLLLNSSSVYFFSIPQQSAQPANFPTSKLPLPLPALSKATLGWDANRTLLLPFTHGTWTLCCSLTVTSRQAGHSLRVLAQTVPFKHLVKCQSQRCSTETPCPGRQPLSQVQARLLPRRRHCFLGLFLQSQLIQELSLPLSLNVSYFQTAGNKGFTLSFHVST